MPSPTSQRPTVVWAFLGSISTGGQQVHEQRLREALRGRWSISDVSIVPWRADGRDGRRLPLRLLWTAPYELATRVGSRLYGTPELVHRLDLRCPPAAGREVPTVHDLPPLRFDDEGSIPRWAARSARAAAAVICPSAFAASEVNSLLGATRVYVVPNGVRLADFEADPLPDAELRRLGV